MSTLNKEIIIKSKKNSILIDLTLIIAISIFVLFYQLGTTTLVNWDEAWFASVAKDMIERGDFLNGQFNGVTWFYEPPLLTWILSLAFTFSDSSFSLRLFNALCGLGIVVTTYVFTRELTKNRIAALLSSLIILSDIEFLFRSRQINTDIPLTFFLLFCLFSLNKFISQKRFFWLLACAISFALATLTKRASPLLILPSLCLLLIHFRKDLFHLRKWWIALLVFLLISAPWYIVNLYKWKTVFLNEYILSFTLNRIDSVNPGTGTSPIFYFEALKHAFKIWTPIVFGGIFLLAAKSKNNKQFLAVIVFIVTFLLTMTLSAKKASWYILPIHPFLAMAGGTLLYKILNILKGKTTFLLVYVSILTIFVFQLYHWKADYIVPDTTSHQASIARYVNALTKSGDTIYLDDYYMPTAVFYSRRQVVPLRYNRLGEEDKNKLEIPAGKYILTNTETIDLLNKRLSTNTQTIYTVRDLILLRTE